MDKNALLPASIVNAAAKTIGPLAIENAPDGIDALVMTEALRQRRGVALYVARDEGQAQTFEAAAKFFAPSIATLRLPAWDNPPYDRISPAAQIAAQRCAALASLAARKPGDPPLLVVTTASAVAQRVPARARMLAGVFQAKASQHVGMAALESYLDINGYGRSSVVRTAGEFAVRGGLIDVFPPNLAEPLRFDFFGDTLESIRAFDPETQRTTRTLKDATLTPVSEIILDNESVPRFRKSFTQAFGTVSDSVYDSVSARIRRQGVEQWLPFFYEHLETVFSYAGPDALIAFEALAEDAIHERVEAARDHYETRRTAPAPRGAAPFRAPAPETFYLADKALAELLTGRPVRRFSHFTSDAGQGVSLPAQPGRNFSAERQAADANVFDAASRHVEALMMAGKRVLFAAWSEGSAERLAGVLTDHGIPEPVKAADWDASLAQPILRPTIAVLPLEHGFETENLAVISEQDLLGDRMARPRKRRKASAFIAEAAALSPGDLVVHQEHGIARYDGLKTLTVQEAPHDCIELIYAGGDKLYLPVENIELVSRYGAEDSEAQLDKLGGVGWQSRKARAKQRLRDMAEELIRIAAQRAARTAEEVLPPEGLYDEFCARFPYEETDDQLAAIEDVVGDLAAGRPMDRLVCGDVGFGKTEVALRAAFLVAMTGKQVAVVAPTTLLCRQHFRTFSDRFHGLPIRVRQLSRLVTAKDASETRKGMADGTIEIVVGTHALLAKNTSFKDLGLLIIDEEQHFGVKHKERLKELRADVHVLTLSATPIPRTLQLALAGIREMSIIATPPIDRMAVRTYVTPFDPLTIREALLKERYRGG
ncbi:MAG: transcription-repair coupling factor, partial [Hyphomonadaceae bacterium]